MPSTRREWLKAYIMACVAEGRLSISDRPTVMLAKIAGCVQEDLPAIAEDFVALLAEHGAKVVTAHVNTKLRDVLGNAVDEIKAHGLGPFWNRIKRAYWAGVESKAR